MNQRRAAVYYKDDLTGKEPVRDWLENLRDKMGQARIYVRIARAENGNFGDHQSVGEGVMELRISAGPGYRLYYALDCNEVILLLCGGDKSSQEKDISIAKKYWTAHKGKSKGG